MADALKEQYRYARLLVHKAAGRQKPALANGLPVSFGRNWQSNIMHYELYNIQTLPFTGFGRIEKPALIVKTVATLVPTQEKLTKYRVITVRESISNYLKFADDNRNYKQSSKVLER